eukprot:COSAG04_NODE_882_length_9663_cov_8.381639_1_plen_25_part_10
MHGIVSAPSPGRIVLHILLAQGEGG